MPVRAGSWATTRVGLTKDTEHPGGGLNGQGGEQGANTSFYGGPDAQKIQHADEGEYHGHCGDDHQEGGAASPMPESKRTFIIGVWGWKRGRVSSSTALVSRIQGAGEEKGAPR